MFSNDPVITSLSNQLEKLSIETHTHELQLKIKRIKRQKTGIKFRRLKRDLLNKDKIMQDTLAKLDQKRYEVEIYHLLYVGELAHLRTITIRCLTRAQQIMASTVPHVPLSVENHNNLAQLLNELVRTIVHLQKPHTGPDSSPIQQPEL